MGTKVNPSKFDCYSQAEPDEPMFILLARDPLAPILVELWARLRREHGCKEHPDRGHDEKVIEALKITVEMQHWRKENR